MCTGSLLWYSSPPPDLLPGTAELLPSSADRWRRQDFGILTDGRLGEEAMNAKQVPSYGETIVPIKNNATNCRNLLLTYSRSRMDGLEEEGFREAGGAALPL